jgi:glycosyltransferase involved in cell wall biosynthesis
MTAPLTIFILTYNEEANIAQALSNLHGCAQTVFIVDSGSTDRTVDIAESMGVTVLHNPWPGYAKQVNWALENGPIETEWVLRLDADEYLTPELAAELERVLAKAPTNISGYYIKRRFYFLGRWIRYGGYYPIWILRLFRYGKGYCEDVPINEHIAITEGDVGRLQHDLIHEDRKGLKDWLLKHERYASLESEFRQKEAVRSTQREAAIATPWKQWIRKNVFVRLPMFMRPMMYFSYRYILRLGFLDRTPGLIYHFLHAFWYQFYIDARAWEMQHVQHTSNDRD